MMRIAVIDPSLFTLPYDAALTRGLRAIGHEVTLHGRMTRANDDLATGIAVEPSFYAVSERLAGLPKPLRLAVKGFDHAASMLALVRRLRREAPDIIHFQWLPLPILDRALLAGFKRVAPVLLTVHDTNPFNGDPTARVQNRGFAAAIKTCDGLIVHTRQGLSRLSALGVPAEKLSRIPHGPLCAAPIARPADAMQNEITFVLFGKLKPYKGADLLIAAYALLPQALRAASRLLIIGQPYMDVAALRAQAMQAGVADRVSIEPKFVRDQEISAIFAPGSVAVFPYREIEASGVLSLALAHGRPVIASEIGEFAESIKHGVHGLLFPREDVVALASAMQAVVADRQLAARFAAGAVAWQASQPRWDDIALMTVRAYAKAAAPKIVGALTSAPFSKALP